MPLVKVSKWAGHANIKIAAGAYGHRIRHPRRREVQEKQREKVAVDAVRRELFSVFPCSIVSKGGTDAPKPDAFSTTRGEC
jgi:hypothetical protein